MDTYLETMPVSIRRKANSFIKIQQAQLYVMGKLLLQKGLADLNSHFSLIDLKYNNHNKPFFKDGPNFSISHSGEFVACAISSECNLGIDLEEIKPIGLDPFESFFSKSDWDNITTCENKLECFYRLWTKKEAVIKAEGSSIQYLKDVEFAEEYAIFRNDKWYVKNVDFETSYAFSLVTNISVKKFSIVKINF